MSCRGAAGAACKDASNRICVCACGGRCHGTYDQGPSLRSKIKSISRPMMAVVDAMDTINLYYPVLNDRRKRRRRTKSFRWHRMLMKHLRIAGITATTATTGRYGVRHSLIEGYALSGLSESLLQEILDILNWIDPPEQSEGPERSEGPFIGPIPLISQHLRDEIEDIIDRLEEPETEEGNTFNNISSYKRGNYARI